MHMLVFPCISQGVSTLSLLVLVSCVIHAISYHTILSSITWLLITMSSNACFIFLCYACLKTAGLCVSNVAMQHIMK